MSFPFAPARDLAEDFEFDQAENDLDAITYDHIPPIERRWLWPGYLPFGNPVLFAAKGETGKGFLFVLAAAYVVLGLPFPGEDSPRDPGRVVWIAGSEDDPFEDLAPRFRAAIAFLVAVHGLAPELAGEQGAIRRIHDLSEWKDGSPFELPGDMARLLAEVRKINDLDDRNRPRSDDSGTPAGPAVRLVVMDPLADLLGERDTISTVKGARRTLRPVKRFARAADVALVIIHHLTADGKVAGSPAVLDALRLAFLIERREDNPDMRVIRRHKGNISIADPQQYTVTGPWPSTHAEFVDATDERAQRVQSARDRGELDPLDEGQSVRERIKAAREAEPPAEPQGYDPGGAQRFKVIRRIREGGQDGPVQTVARDLASRADGRTAASADAGRSLDGWHLVDQVPGMEVTAYADGARSVSYAVTPAS